MANEKRLIDANALIEFIDMGHLRNPLETCFSERDVVDMLESRPTVDAVEVVRCQFCKYYNSIIGLCCVDRKLGQTIPPIRVRHSDFCSYGERRTDG